MVPTVYALVPAKALVTLDVKLTEAPAQTDIVPVGDMVKAGVCAHSFTVLHKSTIKLNICFFTFKIIESADFSAHVRGKRV
jgi:hypothetical protein